MKILIVIVASVLAGAVFSQLRARRIIERQRKTIRRLQGGNPPEAPKKMETSKKLVLTTGIIFAVSSVAGATASVAGMDITFFAAEIAIAGGVFGSAIVSYEIKAKMENVVKIKMAIIKFRLAVGNYLTPEQMAQVEIDNQALEASIDGKIDDAVAQAVNQDPEIPIY